MVTVVSTKPHPDVVKQAICRHCGSTLEYVPNDVKRGCDTDYRGDKDYYNYITCPTCSKEVLVN